MAALRHLGFVMRMFEPSTKGILVVFITVHNLVGIDAARFNSFRLRLRTPIHAPILFIFGGGSIGKGWCGVDPNELFLTL